MREYSATPTIRYTSDYRKHARVPQARGHPRPSFIHYGYPPFFPRPGQQRVYSTSGIRPRPHSDYGRYPRVPFGNNGHSRMPLVGKEHQRLSHTNHAQASVPFEQPARQNFPSDIYGRAYKTKVYYSQQRKATSDANQHALEDRGEQRRLVRHSPTLVNDETIISIGNAQRFVDKIRNEDVSNIDKVKHDGAGKTKEDDRSLEANKGRCDMEQTEDSKVLPQDRIGSSEEETCESISKFLRELLWGKKQAEQDEAILEGDKTMNDDIITDTNQQNGYHDIEEKSFEVYKVAETVGSVAKVNDNIADANQGPAENDNTVDSTSEKREMMEPCGLYRVSKTYVPKLVPQIIITAPEENICKTISEHLHELLSGEKKSQSITEFSKTQHSKADDDKNATEDSGRKTWSFAGLVIDGYKVHTEFDFVLAKNFWDRIAYTMTVLERTQGQLKREDTDCNLEENQVGQGADYLTYEETFKTKMKANIAIDTKKTGLASPDIIDDTYFFAPELGQSPPFICDIDENYFISCFRFH